jgi:pimeloyl-ACP methyl ester carboxylesterase
MRVASGPDMRWSEADLNLYAEVLTEADRARASSACYRTFLLREIPATLQGRYRPSQLQVPTLLLMGEASSLKRTFEPQPSTNLEVEAIPRAGHFLPEEAPAAVLDAAQRFL